MNYPRSVYLHIPFCHRRCFYCDFAVVPLGDKAGENNDPGRSLIKDYLKFLHQEIDLVKEGKPLATIYIGGGTPSLLSPIQIGSLLDHLREKFGLLYGSEITLEIDPSSFNKKDLDGFIEVGINRISLGGQSFDNETLVELGRRHTREQLIESCSWLDDVFKSRRIKSWSLDLIKSLPNRDLDFWKEELKSAVNTFAPHLSIYDLSIEPGTVFEIKKNRGELKLPNDEISWNIDKFTNSFLKEHGFARYEISNYALPGHVSRHNRVYWSGSGWWAFGMGATSAPWGKRFARPRSTKDYLKWIKAQEKEGLDISLLSKNYRQIDLDEQLIVGLRRREGVDIENLGTLWGWDSEEREKYLNSLMINWENAFIENLLIRKGNRVYLSNPEGMAISNQVLVEMLIWWDSLPNDAVSQSIP